MTQPGKHWNDFHNHIHHIDSSKTKNALNTLAQFVEDLKHDYLKHNEAKRSFKMLKTLESTLKNYTSHSHLIAPNEFAILTSILNEFDDDLILQEIRKKGEDFVSFETVSPNKQLQTDSVSPLIYSSAKNYESFNFGVSSELKYSSVTMSTLNTETTSTESKTEQMMYSSSELWISGSMLGSRVKNIRDQINSLVKDIHSYHGDHVLDEAYKSLVQLRDLQTDKNSLSHDDIKYLVGTFDKNEHLFNQIEEEHKEMQLILEELHSNDGWITESIRKDSAVRYKKHDGGTVSLRLETTLDVPLYNVLCLFYEPEGHAAWVPFCDEAKELKKIARNYQVVWERLDFPIPLSDREAYFLGFGVDRLDQNGSVLMVSRSFDKDLAKQKLYGIQIPEKGKHVRMDMKMLGIELKPLGQNKTQFTFVVNMDLKLKFMPLSLLNWFTRKAGQLVIERISKHARKIEGPVWQERKERNKEFYNWLEAKLEKYFSKH